MELSGSPEYDPDNKKSRTILWEGAVRGRLVNYLRSEGHKCDLRDYLDSGRRGRLTRKRKSSGDSALEPGIGKTASRERKIK